MPSLIDNDKAEYVDSGASVRAGIVDHDGSRPRTWSSTDDHDEAIRACSLRVNEHHGSGCNARVGESDGL